MNIRFPWLFSVVLLTLFTQNASSDEGVSYVPFIAVDAVNGSFAQSVKNQLNKCNIEYEFLDSPITATQLKGASILLICGDFQGDGTKPKAGEVDHRLYSNEEIATIKNFVKKGGVLIGAGQTWAWATPCYGNKATKLHPLNQIGEALDFSVFGQCSFDRYERKFLRILPEPKTNVGASYSNVKIKGAYDKLVRSNNGCCGGGGGRGDGYIYIFGSVGPVMDSPEFISSVFLGLSPQKRTNTDLVNNNPEESEPVEKQDTTTQEIPIVTIRAKAPNRLNIVQLYPNIINWLGSPLRTQIPENLEGNIMLLSERILDEAYTLPKNRRKAHGNAVNLCKSLLAICQKRYQRQVSAKLLVARRTANSPLHNQQLDARRNYLMSWPQYEREVQQRAVLLKYRNDANQVASREMESKWTKEAATLRIATDRQYGQMRQSMRELGISQQSKLDPAIKPSVTARMPERDEEAKAMPTSVAELAKFLEGSTWKHPSYNHIYTFKDGKFRGHWSPTYIVTSKNSVTMDWGSITIKCVFNDKYSRMTELSGSKNTFKLIDDNPLITP